MRVVGEAAPRRAPARPGSRARGRRRAAPGSHSELPRTEAAAARAPAAQPGCGGARVRRPRPKRTMPYSATARTPAAEVHGPAPAARGKALDLRASVRAERRRGRRRRARPAGCSTSRRTRGGSAARRAASTAGGCPPAPVRSQRLVHRPLQRPRCLVPQLRSGREHVARPRPGGSRAAAGQHLEAQPVAGQARSCVGLVLRQAGRPPRSTRACRPRGTVEQRVAPPVPERRHAEQRPASRRRRQPVEDGLHLVACRCVRSRPDPARARCADRARPPRSARLARGPRGSRSARIVDPLDVQLLRRARRTARRRTARPAPRRGRSPWLTCSASTRSAPERVRERVQQADGVGAAGEQRQHPRRRRPALPLPRSAPSPARSHRWTYLVFNAGGPSGDRGRAPIGLPMPSRPRHRQPASACLFAARRVLRSLIALLALASVGVDRSAAVDDQAEAVPGELVVGFTPSATAWQEQRAVEKARGEVEDRIESMDAALVTVDPEPDRRRQRAAAAQPGGRVRRAQLRRCAPTGSPTTAASATSGACATSATSTARPAPTSPPPRHGT